MGLLDLLTKQNKNRKFKKQVLQEVERLSREIQATEGSRSTYDALNWSYGTRQRTIRKNNFQEYDEQVDELRKMYHAKTDYGVTLTRSTIDIRTSFIGGEGLSITGGSKKNTSDWIADFLKYNKLKGSKLIESIRLGELEGKCLAIIKKTGSTPEDRKIKVKFVKYSKVKYTVKTDDFDEPVSVSWEDENQNPVTVQAADFAYLNYTDYDGDINNSPPPAANVIDQLINYERALYDLRENNHTFGKITPIVKGEDQAATAAAIRVINDTNWKIGQSLGIQGTVDYLTPGTDALESLRGEMSLLIKLICAVLTVPVHWAGWTDLMSNRATADSLAELVETGTKEIRLKWIEFYTELIRKAMIKSEKFGDDPKDIDGYNVELPQITAEKIKELIDAWFILAEAGYVAKEIIINKLPGVDPEKNKKALAAQKKEEEKEKPKAALDFEKQVDNVDVKEKLNE